MPITRADALKGRDKTFSEEYTQEIEDNLDRTIELVNEFLTGFTGPVQVNSGWRPAAVNSATPGAAPQSKHLLGLAVDLNDPNRAIMRYILENLEKASDLGLYFEDFRHTTTLRNGKIVGHWAHIQVGAPKSRKRIFVPSASLAPDPTAWNGKYDSRHDK